jgi:large subunit ribosomal protein L25
MQSITIKGSKRESVGKKATRELRNADKIPCVVYGGETPIHFAVDGLALNPLVYTPNAYTAVIELDSGETINAIMQDVQFHPVTDKILHADFYALHDDKPVTMWIPVKLEGLAIGVRNGGVLRNPYRKLSITSLPKDLPDFIKIDISPLKIGDKVLVELAKTIHENINNFDIVARLTGDEFLIALTDIKTKDEAINIAQKIIEDFASKDIIINTQTKQILKKTICIGISYYPQDANTINQVIKNADMFLYEAKNEGRSIYKVYEKNQESSIELF